MNIKISEALNEILGFSRDEAMRTGSYSIGPDHLFLGMLRHANNMACDILIALGIDLKEMKDFIDTNIFTNETIPFSDAENILLSRQGRSILNVIIMEITNRHVPVACPQHLLLALCSNINSYGYRYLSEHGVDVIVIDRCLDEISKQGEGGGNDEAESAEEKAPQKEGGKSIDITEYGYDLTAAAVKGLLDPVVGRDLEISRVVEILGRRKKNNPMLIGEPGVGKSAIVEGIALQIASGNIPAPLKNKRIVSLDIASIVAGTRYRGDFEKRLKEIIRTAASDPNLILFIDEFHTIVGAGGSGGNLDAANMLKPALARGEFQCIGATTIDEFRKIVEKDGALERRFEKITVNPTDIEGSIRILNEVKPTYEAFHKVEITDEAVDAAVRLTQRYIPERFLPDKAIDAMDEASSMVKLRKTRNKKVKADDIAVVVSKMTGIPANKVASGESGRLLNMEKWLKARIVGQDDAVSTISRAIRRNRAGLKDPNRPIGTFLFFGPTGVGKTRLTHCLAEYLFDSSDALVRIDMSEYMEKISTSKLIGAPPGYVGYEEGGQLSERVRRNPYCVVLFDEIEKAHPDVFNLLLQVMDEGRLTDNNGRTIDFKNTLIIMTSNVGSREVEEYGKGVGFSTSSRNIETAKTSILLKAARKAFPPEFLNRIDEMVSFNSLGRDDISRIIGIEIEDVKKRAIEAGYKIKVTPNAMKFIADAGFDPAFGARPLKRAISRHIEDPVSEYILEDKALNKRGDKKIITLKVDLNPEGDSTVVSI